MQIAESAHEAIMLLEEERDANIRKATEAEERTLEAIDARDAFKKVPSVCAMPTRCSHDACLRTTTARC